MCRHHITYEIFTEHCDTNCQARKIPPRTSDFTSALDPRPQRATLAAWLSITSIIYRSSSAGLFRRSRALNITEPDYTAEIPSANFQNSVQRQLASLLFIITESEAEKLARSIAAQYGSCVASWAIIHPTTAPKIFLKSPRLY